jgi:ELWxxDGT repeat protein
MVDAVDDPPTLETSFEHLGRRNVTTFEDTPVSLSNVPVFLETTEYWKTRQTFQGKNFVPVFSVPFPPGPPLGRSEQPQPFLDGSWVVSEVPAESGLAFMSPSNFFLHQGQLFLSATISLNGSSYGAELAVWSSSRKLARLAKDLSPGHLSSTPHSFASWRQNLFFSASGLHLDYVLDDSCSGIKTIPLGEPDDEANTVVLVAASNTTWDSHQTFSCPVGFQWATTHQFNELLGEFNLNPQAVGQEPSGDFYANSCGWSGLEFKGSRREKFRFQDSALTGGFKHASSPIKLAAKMNDFGTSEFAGIVCISTLHSIAAQNNDSFTGSHGQELWKLNTETNVATIVADIRAGTAGSNPMHLVAANFADGTLIAFTADAFPHGRELYCSDGTAGGTSMVKDIYRGLNGSAPADIVFDSQRSTLLFSAFIPSFGRELWTSDGTRAGTNMVSDILSGSKSSDPKHLYFCEDLSLTFFSAFSTNHGRELWATDGTAGGTGMIMDIFTGPGDSTPDQFTQFGGQLFFVATTAQSGREIWRSAGSWNSTELVTELVIGIGSSSPQQLSIFKKPDNSRHLIFHAFASRAKQIRSASLSIWTISEQLFAQPLVETTSQTVDIEPESEETQLENRRLIQFEDLLVYSGRRSPVVPNVQGFPAFCYRGTCNPNAHVAALVQDSDSPPNATVQLSFLSEKGKIFLPDNVAVIRGSNFGRFRLDVVCVVRECNTLLQNVTYVPLKNVNGHDQVKVQLRSLQSNRVVSSKVSEAFIEVTIVAVDDKPHWDAPLEIWAPQNAAKVLGGIELLDTLVGVVTTQQTLDDGRNFQVTLTATNGVISLFGTDGVYVVEGSGLKDRRITIVGSPSSINSCIQFIQYECMREFGCSAVEDIIALSASEATSRPTQFHDEVSHKITVRFFEK